MSREMVNTGIPWIGEIPLGWEVCKLKRKYRLLNGRAYSDSELLTEGKYRILRVGNLFTSNKWYYSDLELEENKYCTKGDLLYGWSASIGPYLWEEDKVIYHYHIWKVLFAPNNRRYAYYQLHALTDAKKQDMHGSAMQHLTMENMSNSYIATAPLNEQYKIASFLDKKCDEIDEMIALQEKIIEELKAYKLSVITEAVTKGLNPNVPMKDSEIDWIGKIPEHWGTSKFKTLFNIKKDIAGVLGYDILSVTQHGLKIKDLSKNEGQIAQDYSKYQLVDIDDFVMNHMDLLTGYIDCAKVSGVTSPDYRTFVNRNPEIADNNFFLQIFQKCYKDKTFYHLGQGVSFLGRWRLPKEQLNAFVLPVPPLNEQKVIANFLNQKCSEIDALIKIKLSKIDSLKEYKKSIIYEYVTGKKEVTL